MRVVLDTNVMVSQYIAPRGTIARLFDYWNHYAFDLVVSDLILEEYQQVLTYPRIQALHRASPEAIHEYMQTLIKLAVVVTPSETIDAIPDDPSDNKFIECAVVGNAEYIVSGDAHLLNLQQYRGIEILLPSPFVDLLEELIPA